MMSVIEREGNEEEDNQLSVVKVCEIFASIQGESTFAGRPCVFVRLSGCNLRCRYCDTMYAYEQGRTMPCDDVLTAVHSYGIGLVEVTGGEPLLQEGVFSLVSRLLDEAMEVLVETNGSVSIASLDSRAVVIMDLKCPSSGMAERMVISNIPLLKPKDQVKFVLSGREDYDWARGFIDEHALSGKCTILLSPVYGLLPPADLSRWIVADRLPVRLNLQLHKYVFGPDERGV